MGWLELAGQVGAVLTTLSPDQRQSAVLLAQDYGEAGALVYWRHAYHLPEVYSGHNELATWMPPSTATAVVAVGIHPDLLAPAFAQCTTVGSVELGPGIVNQAQHDPITVCVGRKTPWPRLAHLG